jgi:hypothetical protein
MPDISREFPLIVVLPILDEYPSRKSLGNSLQVLSFMTEKEVAAASPFDAARECRGAIFDQHPALASIELPAVGELRTLSDVLTCAAWIRAQEQTYGATIRLFPIGRQPPPPHVVCIYATYYRDKLGYHELAGALIPGSEDDVPELKEEAVRRLPQELKDCAASFRLYKIIKVDGRIQEKGIASLPNDGPYPL